MAGKKYIIADWQVSGGEPLRHHQVALCLLLALGAPDSAVFELLPGLTPGQLAMLRSNQIITAAVAEHKERFLGENAKEQFTRHLPKAFQIMEEVLNADPQEMKLAQRFEAAKWLFEKTTGKAKQELELSGGITIVSLMDALDKMKLEAAKAGQPLKLKAPGGPANSRDVTPAADPLAAWVTENVTAL